jgi:hypothetical protein
LGNIMLGILLFTHSPKLLFCSEMSLKCSTFFV